MKSDWRGEFFGIRRHRIEDIPSVFEAIRESIAEISPWMPWCHDDYTVDETSLWIRSRAEEWRRDKAYDFVIHDLHTQAVVGGVGLNTLNRQHQIANLGYWVRTARTGQGIATAATLLAARFGIEELGLRRIEIVAEVKNVASQRVAEKAGAKKEAVIRKRLLNRGESRDAVLYSLVAEDLNANL